MLGLWTKLTYVVAVEFLVLADILLFLSMPVGFVVSLILWALLLAITGVLLRCDLRQQSDEAVDWRALARRAGQWLFLPAILGLVFAVVAYATGRGTGAELAMWSSCMLVMALVVVLTATRNINVRAR